MPKPILVIPAAAVVGLSAAAVLTVSVGSLAQPVPLPRPAVVIGTPSATPVPTAMPAQGTPTTGPELPGTDAPARAATTSPTHEPTGTPTGTGKRQQGKQVSNPGPRHG